MTITTSESMFNCDETRVGSSLSYVDLSVSFELVLLVDISLLAVFHVFELVDPMFESSGFMLTLLSTSQTEPCCQSFEESHYEFCSSGILTLYATITGASCGNDIWSGWMPIQRRGITCMSSYLHNGLPRNMHAIHHQRSTHCHDCKN